VTTSVGSIRRNNWGAASVFVTDRSRTLQRCIKGVGCPRVPRYVSFTFLNATTPIVHLNTLSFADYPRHCQSSPGSYAASLRRRTPRMSPRWLRLRSFSLRDTWTWTKAPSVRLSGLSPILLALLIITPVMLSHARPSDETWLAGIYDQADFDDAVGFLTSALEATDSTAAPQAGPCLALAPRLCLATVACSVSAPAYSAPLRAPPIA